ncbi:helix-turn-helix domain-containing protein [Herbiconiux flava]|uniref:Helix-turn-helix domain-containing protein n=1 Tax=Herbiconiux flava TaxID=881268 RepID=A0A852STI9_9MICO|nr:helix-turn-helix domain-containing protein [Herbiconiux flava]NYD72306.1 hypothetical protein [Herbiconiux flava]
MDQLPYDIATNLEQRVLLKLCNVADVDGSRAFRSKADMARELGCDPKSVQRALRKLESLDLIRQGDQRLVAHLRAGYRPTVYNLNFGYHRMYAQPEIDLAPELDNDPEIEGGQSYPQVEAGGTLGGTVAVPLGTGELLNQDLEKEPYVGDRARAHEPAKPVARWADARCPGDWQHYTHELGAGGKCVHCFERPVSIGVAA